MTSGRQNASTRRGGVLSPRLVPLWLDLVSLVLGLWVLWWALHAWHDGALPKLAVVLCVLMVPIALLRCITRLSHSGHS